MSAEALPGPSGWEPDASTFGARLAMVRHRMGWNMAEAAKACGIARSSWDKWESGKACREQERVARQVSIATGCNYFWLFAGPDASRPIGVANAAIKRGTSVE